MVELATAGAGSRTDRIVLEIEPADASGSALRLVTAPTAHVAVATRRVLLAGIEVVLDVLAASHRVRARHLPTGDEVHETVACAAGIAPSARPDRGDQRDGPAPRATWRAGRWRATFRSDLEPGTTSILAAHREIGRALDRAAGLAVQFPGGPDAVTALAVHAVGDDGVEWSTWHLYPGADPHVVRTTTVARWG